MDRKVIKQVVVVVSLLIFWGIALGGACYESAQESEEQLKNGG